MLADIHEKFIWGEKGGGTHIFIYERGVEIIDSFLYMFSGVNITIQRNWLNVNCTVEYPFYNYQCLCREYYVLKL